MAIIILGSSTCAICKRILNEADAIRSFPHFMPNLNDELSFISDSAVHTSCFVNHPLKSKVESLVDRYDTSLKELKKYSFEEYDTGNIINFPAFTSDASEPLHQFNFAIVNLNDSSQTNFISSFILEANSFLKLGKWKQQTGKNILEYLIERLRHKKSPIH